MVERNHESVMLQQSIEAIAPRPGGVYADATAGGGGHSEALLQASAPDGRVIAVDTDSGAVEVTRKRLAAFGARAIVLQGRFADLGAILEQVGDRAVDGLVADLGLSSLQLDDPQRGFAFSHPGPLDMRMDRSRGQTAAELIAHLKESALADILYRFGQERRSRAIARSIKRAQEKGALGNTDDLRRSVVRVLGPRRRGKVDPATRTFQAIRIAVNDELGQLQSLIDALPDLLRDEGTAVIISFHSLEDRIVKQAFASDPRLQALTRRPLAASEQERERNPRARSARLRAARRRPRQERSGEAAA
jgi:16S rRNA (cytosine1402-N4)-methyltransferase